VVVVVVKSEIRFQTGLFASGEKNHRGREDRSTGGGRIFVVAATTELRVLGSDGLLKDIPQEKIMLKTMPPAPKTADCTTA
jgi:hypothetical protein